MFCDSGYVFLRWTSVGGYKLNFLVHGADYLMSLVGPKLIWKMERIAVWDITNQSR